MNPDFKYIDIHGHINFAAYDADREAVIARAKDAGVAMVAVGSQYETSKSAVELANKHDNIFAAIGVHPAHSSASHYDENEFGPEMRDFTLKGEDIDVAKYIELAKDPKVVAIGESGLDFYHCEADSENMQVAAFEKMIDVANAVNKPLMLHIRNGVDKSAYKQAYEILKDQAKVVGNLHFFAGSIEEAKPFLEIGYSFSFTGVLTFTHNYDDVVRYIPDDRIMSETDCPYVSPVPFRGKRNEPVYVIEVVKAIARIKSQPEEVVAEKSMENAQKFFARQ